MFAQEEVLKFYMRLLAMGSNLHAIHGVSVRVWVCFFPSTSLLHQGGTPSEPPADGRAPGLTAIRWCRASPQSVALRDAVLPETPKHLI